MKVSQSRRSGFLDEDYHLDGLALSQLLRDGRFYVDCPLYLFMEKTGLSAAEAYDQAVAQRTCCNGAGDPIRALAPAFNAFLRISLRAAQISPSLFDPLKDYIRQKTGKRPEKISMSYRTDSGIQFLRI